MSEGGRCVQLYCRHRNGGSRHRIRVGVGVARFRCLEIGGGSAAGEMSALVWPLMPFLSLLWFLTGDLMAREASGFATAGPCMLIALVLAAMVGVAVRALYLGGLPAWAYPGWMARRYYASHPGARERELGARAVI